MTLGTALAEALATFAASCEVLSDEVEQEEECTKSCLDCIKKVLTSHVEFCGGSLKKLRSCMKRCLWRSRDDEDVKVWWMSKLTGGATKYMHLWRPRIWAGAPAISLVHRQIRRHAKSSTKSEFLKSPHNHADQRLVRRIESWSGLIEQYSRNDHENQSVLWWDQVIEVAARASTAGATHMPRSCTRIFQFQQGQFCCGKIVRAKRSL